MKIPRNLSLKEFKLFILQVAEKVGVRITAVKFNPLLKNASGLAHPDDSIELRIPLRREYNPKRYLYIIIHEIAHLKQRQQQKKWGHKDLPAITRGIYHALGWSMGHDYYCEESYCRMMAQEEKIF